MKRSITLLKKQSLTRIHRSCFRGENKERFVVGELHTLHEPGMSRAACD